MVGRPIEAEYPERSQRKADAIAFEAKELNGSRFNRVTMHVFRGEILGFAGAEANGQRETLRALGGLEEASGTVYCDGTVVRTVTPAEALDAGILSLSGDRAAESIFPALGVRENMTVQVLESFA